ncbi:hypothetical protein [Bradyrhizobium sp. Ai1a-2]|uniref:hypothetical protein n=1 Tax=Bradyrhizobium sp. Ai1a-2 TaxID=196490 RepID=UPI0004058433|nr:hypothetical protein [Bradyrhizobium sp. Ai1a-2]
MSRQERLKEYANPRREANWDGAASDKANLDRWAARASENSAIAPRARSGEVRLPDTGMNVHDSAAPPRRDRGVDARMKAKADLDTDGGSSYMRSIRRNA